MRPEPKISFEGKTYTFDMEALTGDLIYKRTDVHGDVTAHIIRKIAKPKR